MDIDIIYGQGAANNDAPAGFYTAVNYVVNYLDQLFTNNVTININISYGAILDPYTGTYSSLGSNDLGESYRNNEQAESYSAVRNALLADNAPGASTLPVSSPVSGTLLMGSAEAKALGLIGPSTALDGAVGVSASAAWDFTPNTTPTANEYYLVGVLEHEITEAMGRVSYLDSPGDYSVADLYRYSSPGVRSDTPGGNGSTAYFSIDNGTTDLGSWNNQISNGDLADWYPHGPAPGGNDAFNDYSNPGVINVMSSSDITLMQALGWTMAGQTSAPPTITTTNITVAVNHSVAASSLFSISNPNNDNITQYSFEDNGSNGHFAFGGTIEPNGQAFTVSAANLGLVQYVGGSAAATDTLVVDAYDATSGSWLTSASLTAVTSSSPALVNATSFTVSANQSVAASSLFSLSNPNGDSVTKYTFEDNGGGSGHLVFNGTVEPDGQPFTVSAPSLSQVQYVGGTAAGTDTLTINAYDATLGTSLPESSASAVTTAPFPFANNGDVTEAIYIGYFGRAADPSGEAYWINQLNNGSIAETGMAASFSVQPEATALYAFLASPANASVAQIESFISSVYEDLFDRAPDASGLTYWQNQLRATLGNPQAVGSFILDVIGGAQAADVTTISNKVTVADYLSQLLAADNISFTSGADAIAHSAISAVTSAASSVLAAEATINSWIATHPNGAELGLVGVASTSAASMF